MKTLIGLILLHTALISTTVYAGNAYIDQAQKDLRASAEQNKKQLKDIYTKNTNETLEEEKKRHPAMIPPAPAKPPARSLPAWEQAVTPPPPASAKDPMHTQQSKPESSTNIYR